MLSILSVVGARPQFIKAAIVSSKLRTNPSVHEMLVHTGQHYDQTMSDVFFKQLEIPKPDINLGAGKASTAGQIGKILIGLDGVLKTERFDWVLVYGDTNSTLAGALAAVKADIPLAHVEAGLRSFNRAMPEEVNRIITDHLADLLFTPTKTADSNLHEEGVPPERISRVGDVMYDSILLYREVARLHSHILHDLKLIPKNYAVGTIHRAGNTDDAQTLEVILKSLELASKHVRIVLPLHPRTQAAIAKHNLARIISPDVLVIDPLSYLDMLQLEANANLIITDSGGVQKEAYFLGVPCVILRGETEWVELLENEGHSLAPPDDATEVAKKILATISRPMSSFPDTSLFGDGHAAEKILDRLLKAN